MKIFNLENSKQVQPKHASKAECVVIGTFDEWKEVMAAVDEMVKKNPRKKKLKKVQEDLEFMAVW